MSKSDREIKEETAKWLEAEKLKQSRHEELLKNIKAHLPELEALYARYVEVKVGDEIHPAEDLVYRFYHYSFKVYRAQQVTEDIVTLLKKIAPEGCELCDWFEEIVRDGTGKVWDVSHNKKWTKHTRPIMEAYFHAIYFLRVIVRYGRTLDQAPNYLPSGWAAVLELYNIR